MAMVHSGEEILVNALTRMQARYRQMTDGFTIAKTRMLHSYVRVKRCKSLFCWL